jgi:hypothetical protein
MIIKLKCRCEKNETEYDDDYGSVDFVDAIRYLMSICDCEAIQ